MLKWCSKTGNKHKVRGRNLTLSFILYTGCLQEAQWHSLSLFGHNSLRIFCPSFQAHQILLWHVDLLSRRGITATPEMQTSVSELDSCFPRPWCFSKKYPQMPRSHPLLFWPVPNISLDVTCPSADPKQILTPRNHLQWDEGDQNHRTYSFCRNYGLCHLLQPPPTLAE